MKALFDNKSWRAVLAIVAAGLVLGAAILLWKREPAVPAGEKEKERVPAGGNHLKCERARRHFHSRLVGCCRFKLAPWLTFKRAPGLPWIVDARRHRSFGRDGGGGRRWKQRIPWVSRRLAESRYRGQCQT